MASRLQFFEGLVLTTARMFADQVGREEHDLAQELRVRVWKAIEAFDSRRSGLPLERFVYGAIANKIKDFKRDAAREQQRRERNGIAFVHIEDVRLGGHTDSEARERFDGRYSRVEREEVYGRSEGEVFVMPATVTDFEARVLVLMMMDLTKPEIALRLGVSKWRVAAASAVLREKFADWRPQAETRTVELTLVA